MTIDFHRVANRILIRAILAVGLSGTGSGALSSGAPPAPEQEADRWSNPVETLTGTVELEHFDDFAAGRGGDIAVLAAADGSRLVIEGLSDTPLNLEGAKVRLTGRRAGSDFVLAEGAGIQSVELIQSSVVAGFSLASMSTAAGPPTVKRVAVVLFNFMDDAVQSYTANTIRTTTFTSLPPSYSVNAYYQENSFGRIMLQGKLRSDGDIFGYYTIPYPHTGCDTRSWMRAAMDAARPDGFDPAGYDAVVFSFPQSPSCGWSGYSASLGFYGFSSVKYAAINGSYYLNIVAHELGHDFGLGHAKAYVCTQGGVPVPVGDTCTSMEYGDPFDVMGSGARHMDNIHKSLLGYLEPTNVLTVTQSGTYTLAPIEVTSLTLQGLVIPRPDSSQLWLEFRQTLGIDSFGASHPVTNGVSIRLSGSGGVSYLLDTTPSCATCGTNLADAALAVGRTFTDPISGATVRTVSVSSAGAVVDVTLAGTYPTSRLLTVVRSGLGTGTVTATPAGISCGADCSEAYATGTVVTLIPLAAAGSTFQSWGGDADCSDGVVTMAAATSCTATFMPTVTTADLTVPGLSAPSATGAGLTFLASDTTRNAGTGPAPATVTAYYLSRDRLLDSGDRLLATRAVLALVPGASSTATIPLTIPADIASGGYYLLATADANRLLAEPNEGNNTFSRAVIIGPNLIVPGITSPSYAASGSSIVIGDTVQNRGAGTAAPTATRFFLSLDANYSAVDTPLGSRLVAGLLPGASSSGSVTVNLPSGRAGSFYIIAMADGDQRVLETNESDNLRVKFIVVGSDLIVSALTVPTIVHAGVAFAATESTRNRAQSAAAASTTAYYLSIDPTYGPGDLRLASQAVPGLAAGLTNTATRSLTIPAGTAPGRYYVVARADDAGGVPETSEVNNVLARSLTLY